MTPLPGPAGLTPLPGRAGLTPLRWTKARRSDSTSACVEVMIDSGVYHVRDTKDAGVGPVVRLGAPDWRRLRDLLLGTHRSVLGTPTQVADLRITTHTDGFVTIERTGDGSMLRFTPVEVECFLDGLCRGEFDPLPQQAALTA